MFGLSDGLSFLLSLIMFINVLVGAPVLGYLALRSLNRAERAHLIPPGALLALVALIQAWRSWLPQNEVTGLLAIALFTAADVWAGVKIWRRLGAWMADGDDFAGNYRI